MQWLNKVFRLLGYSQASGGYHDIVAVNEAVPSDTAEPLMGSDTADLGDVNRDFPSSTIRGDIRPIKVDNIFYDPHTVYSRMEELYLSNGDMATAIDTVVNMLFRLKFIFRSSEKSDEVRWDEWVRKTNFYDKLETLIRNRLIYGNAYAQIVKYPGEDYININVLHPYYVYAEVDSYGRVKSWVYNSTKKRRIKPENMLVFRDAVIGVSPYGLPPGLQIQTVIDRKDKLQNVAYVMAFYTSAGLKVAQVNTEGLMTTKDDNGESNRDKYLKAVQRILNNVIKVRENGTVEIMSGITVEDRVKIDSFHPKSDFKGLHTILNEHKRAIYSRYHVPLVMVGQSDDSNRASSYNEMVAFLAYIKRVWNDTVLELTRLTKRLGLSGKFDHEEILKDDIITATQAAWRIADIGNRGWLSSEEVREMVGDMLGYDLDPTADVNPITYTQSPRTGQNEGHDAPASDQPSEYSEVIE